MKKQTGFQIIKNLSAFIFFKFLPLSLAKKIVLRFMATASCSCFEIAKRVLRRLSKSSLKL